VITVRHSRVLFAAAAVLLAVGMGGPAQAQSYPSKPVQLVVGYPAAGASGQIARIIAPALSQALGQPVEVVDRLGQDGILAATQVAKSPGDGYTLLFTTTGMVTFHQFLHKNLPYNPQQDFAAVSLIAGVDNVLLVRPGFAGQTVADAVRMAQAAPGKMSYARVDVASTNTLAMLLLTTLTGAEINMPMTWTNVERSMQAVVDGQVDFSMQNIPAALPWIRDGRLRALATTGRARARALPDVPTIGETIEGYRANAWFGVVAPRATPREIVRLLNSHISRFLAQPATQALFDQVGAETIGGTPDEFEAFIQAERTKWRRVVAAANIGSP